MRLDARALAIPGRLMPTDLAARPGERIALIGPNGGGKTSLLRALAGVEEALGSVRIDGAPLATGAARGRQLAFLPASRDLGWPIPVRDLVRLGVPDAAAADRWLAAFELDALAERPVNRLSTGERARAMMARTLAHGAALLLLDEPLSNLEPYWALRFIEAIAAESKRGATVLCALHDLDLLDRFDRVLLIADGRVQLEGTGQKVLESPDFARIFRVKRGSGGWRIGDHRGELGLGGELAAD